MGKFMFMLALLFLVSLASATCTFHPEDPEDVESFESAMGLVIIAILISVVISALAYLLGKVTANPKLLVFSKDEVTHLGVTILLFICIISFFEGSCQFFNNFLEPGAGSLLDRAQDYMYALQVKGQIITESLLENSIKEKFKGAKIVGYMAPVIGGEMVYMHAFHNAFARQYEVLADMTTVGMVSAGVQYYILLFAQRLVFPIFLPFGLLLRAFPFVREAGNVLLAITFAILIILPFAYVVNSSAADIGLSTLCDEQTEKVLGNCEDVLGWGTIAAFLFQTIFLPNLALVIFITGATAMIKVAKVIP